MKTKLISFKAQTAILSAMAAIIIPNAFADGVSAFDVPSTGAALDYVNAKPMKLPQATSMTGSQLDSLMQAQSSTNQGTPVSVLGSRGDGKLSPVTVPASVVTSTGDEIGSQEYGTSNHVFTTNKTDANGDVTTKYYPFRAAGKLYFNIGTGTYVCSASLIKQGVVVTAAHCVAGFGTGKFYTGWKFYPGLDNNTAYYGSATVKKAYVMSSYLNGTDSCAQAGVVCQNDVAVLLLNTRTATAGDYIGDSTGWFGYGYGGYSYANNQVLITQLGYPVALDSGLKQERTDSQGYKSTSMSNNTVIGSLQTGGSSGGPWVVNLGMAPALNGTSFGTAAGRNVVVGTTSWGYTATGVKEQGASPFTSTNIVPLLNAACTLVPTAC